MADEKPHGFWRRLKDKLVGTAGPATRQGPLVSGGDGANSVLSTSELKTDTVGRVYAEALLELAREQGQVDALADEAQQLLPVIAEGGELNRLFVNPAISDEERSKIVERVFKGRVSDTFYNLLRVLSDKGRLGSLPQVAAGYLLAVADVSRQRFSISFFFLFFC